MTIPTMPTTPAADGPHRATDDAETVYFEGSPLLRGELHALVAWGLAGVVLLAAVVLNLAMWHQRVPAWAYAAAVLLALGFLAVPSLLRRTIKYRITNYRIDVTRGLLARTVDTLELWHIEDLRMRQSIAGRIFNCGTITVLSHNDAMPKLEMFGLPAPQELFRHLEQRVIAVKRQQGVIKVDTGS